MHVSVELGVSRIRAGTDPVGYNHMSNRWNSNETGEKMENSFEKTIFRKNNTKYEIVKERM
jgi:hypothetical protein